MPFPGRCSCYASTFPGLSPSEEEEGDGELQGQGGRAHPCCWPGRSAGSAVALHSCLLAGLRLSLLDPANAQPEPLATWMVIRREVCLFCLVSCTNSFLGVFINNSAHGKGEGRGGTRSCEETRPGRGGRGTQEPCLQPWPSDRAQQPQGPCLGELGPAICSRGTERPFLPALFHQKLTQDTWALMTTPDQKEA